MVVVDMPAVELPTSPRWWTFDDLLALPESIWRFEIVDGALLMTPPAGLWHEAVAVLLRDLIKDAARPDVALGPVAIDIDPTFLIPDLVLLRHEAVRRGGSKARASDVLLVVEVVSPGSVSNDRILKPAKYAEAGIPHFWRVEFRPELSLTAYALPAGATTYTEVGTWTAGQTAPIRAPFEVDIEIAELAPDR
ncbi:Uma2 family endonuclease [Jiangella muralis]|uniref:Uma2 family endonuclease n=1 Tax=Jiangella muralis TaxID=702383 RepID=UPI00069E4C42|nr:Uma2 family endonuclease [Jiangella muralis]